MSGEKHIIKIIYFFKKERGEWREKAVVRESQ